VVPQTRTVYQVTLTTTCNRCHQNGPPSAAPVPVQRAGPTPNPLPRLDPGPLPLVVRGPLPVPLARPEAPPLPRLLPRPAVGKLPLPLAQPDPLPLPQALAQTPDLRTLLRPDRLLTPVTSNPLAEEAQPKKPADGLPLALLEGMPKPAVETANLLALPDANPAPALLAALPATVLQAPAGSDPAPPNPDARASGGDAPPQVPAEPSLPTWRPRHDLQVPPLPLPDTVLQLPASPEAPADTPPPAAGTAEAPPALPALVIDPPALPPVPATVLQPPAARSAAPSP
jgi:hypothetical protein